MPTNRPSVPRPLARALLLEAGHRCAIPTCRATTTEMAHIEPWRKVKRHDFRNMIALCPTCHTRFDQGQIDRTAMRQYKDRLRKLDVSPVHLVEVYRRFQSGMKECVKAIRDLVGTVLFGSGGVDLVGLGGRCTEALDVLAATVDELKEFGNYEELSTCAARIYDWYQREVKSAVDLSIFSMSGSEREADVVELDELVFSLHDAICSEIGLRPDELDL